MRLIQNGINLWLIQTSEHAASSESLDGAKTDDVSEACGSKQRGMAHATEKGCVGKLCALIGVFDGRLADANGDGVADTSELVAEGIYTTDNGSVTFTFNDALPIATEASQVLITYEL